MAASQDVKLKIGEDWIIICTCHDANGQPMAINSAEWRLASTEARIYLASTGSGEITIANSVVTVTVNAASQVTANVQPGSYVHELFVVGNTSVGSIQVEGRALATQSLKAKYP